MLFVEAITFATLGLIVGSFLNVCILRLNTGRSNSGRSGCMSCGAQLVWYELIPVFSFLGLRGRCRTCGSRISHQYWLVESVTSLLFLLVWMQHFSIVMSACALVIVSLLVVIAAYDIKHTIIPNTLVYALFLTALVAHIYFSSSLPLIDLVLYVALVMVSGLIVALPLGALWFFSKGRWMGFGDVKLAMGFGLILGTYKGLMAVMLGFIVGAIVSVFLMYAPKVMKRLSLSRRGTRFTMNSEIPFAPFLIVGFFLVFLFNVDVIALSEIIYGFIL